VLPQPEDCATPFDEDCDGMAPACKGLPLWAKRFGDAKEQHGRRIATDAAGNLVVAGFFTGSIDLGGGPMTATNGQDVFLAELDANGGYRWSQHIVANGGVIESVAADSTGAVVVVGFFFGTMTLGADVLTSAGGQDVFVAKFSGDGTPIWAKRFGDVGAQFGMALAIDGVDELYVAGRFLGALDLGAGPLVSAGSGDVFVAKLDANGGPLWSRSFGDAAEQGCAGISVDGAGDVYVLGDFAGSIDFGNGALTSAGGTDVFLAKLGADGGTLWSKSFGDPNEQHGTAIASDGAGGVFIAGDFAGALNLGGMSLPAAGPSDMFVGRFDADGAHHWSNHFGQGGPSQIASGLSVDPFGHLVLAGYFSGAVDFGGGSLPSVGGEDAFVAKLDAEGGHQWSRRFGDAGYSDVYAVATGGAGEVYVIGDFSDSITFTGNPLVSAGGTDAFVAAFGP
jgi:hypothetical protein